MELTGYTVRQSELSEPITITLTRYREPDWLVLETLDALTRQEGVSGEVILLDQNWSKEFAEQVVSRTTPTLKFDCVSCEEKGICFARNQGFARANSPIVLQLDPDTIPEPGWAAEIVFALRNHGAAVAGSRILPHWRGNPPVLARSKVVLDQYSVLDWGGETVPVNRIVSAGFGVDRRNCAADFRFDESFGRRNGQLFNGAESDFCKRIQAAGGKVIYVGEAVVRHQILPERMRWSWVLRRLYFAGAGRRQQGGSPSPSRRPGVWDWILAPILVPPYALGYFRARRPMV